MARLLDGFVCGAVLACCISLQAQSGPRTDVIMPVPSSVTSDSGAFRIEPGLTVGVGGAPSDRLQRGVLRAMKRLEDRTGQPLPRQLASGDRARLLVTVNGDGGAVQGVDEDESYTLRVTTATISIDAATTAGALHGLETLIQLVQVQGNTYVVPALTVKDSPRFPWRGLMLDCSRHFEPLDVLKRNIDGMAAVKLNVFHWHLTDDQGFRMESKVYPQLTGAGSDALFYTQDQARELVQYARDRGIRVVPEFEMPGHSSAWLIAFPKLGSGTAPQGIRREFGISDVALDPTREETYVFIEAFLREMTQIFPDRYVHIGGDETPAPDWKTNSRIMAFKAAHSLGDNDALQAYFNQRVLAILTKLDRRMVGWDEILNPGLPKDVVVQSWRGEASLAKGAQQGYQGVLSAPYYLDAMKPASQMYLADPVPSDTALSPAQQKLILGGEVTMWAEQLDARTIDSRVWPRTAAIAERFWSAQNVRDVDSMYARLAPVSIELEGLGLRHLSNEGAMLRSLVDSEDIGLLGTVARAFEPVSFGERYEQQRTSQLTPLTNFVDAVRPDPPAKHALAKAAAALVRDPKSGTVAGKEARRDLQNFFADMTQAEPEAHALAAAHPRLLPMLPRLELLQRLTTVGTEALQYLQNGHAPDGWKSRGLATINEAKQPSQSVRYVFLDPLLLLVNAVQ